MEKQTQTQKIQNVEGRKKVDCFFFFLCQVPMHFIAAARFSYSWVESTLPVYLNLGEHKDFLLLQPSLMTHSSDDSIFSDRNSTA